MIYQLFSVPGAGIVPSRKDNRKESKRIYISILAYGQLLLIS